MAPGREQDMSRNAYMVDYRNARRAAGICTVCGGAMPERVGMMRCRSCQKRHTEWAKARKYGMTIEEYYAFISGSCAICGGKAAVVDHDHNTGKVRGALCKQCNLLLGHCADDIVRLEAAVRYLRAAR